LTAVADDDRAARKSIKPLIATLLGWFANQPKLPIFTDFGLTPKDVSVIRQSYAQDRTEKYLTMSQGVYESFVVRFSFP
jgi:hypothetical protein